MLTTSSETSGTPVNSLHENCDLQAAVYIHWEICKHYNIEVTDKRDEQQ